MADIHSLANAVIRMEGSDDPKSVNMNMVRNFNRWNVGHITWKDQKGAVPVYIAGRNWAGWPTREESYEGLLRQIRLDASRGQTLEQFIEKYAPPSENETENYIQNVSRWIGVDRRTPLSAIVGGTATPTTQPTQPGQPAQPQSPAQPLPWMEDLAQTINAHLGVSLTGTQAVIALAGTALLLVVVATPSRSPAY